MVRSFIAESLSSDTTPLIFPRERKDSLAKVSELSFSFQDFTAPPLGLNVCFFHNIDDGCDSLEVEGYIAASSSGA